MRTLTVEIDAPAPARLLAPAGIATPHDAVVGFHVEGGHILQVLPEPELGLTACLIAPTGGPLRLRYEVAPAPAGCPYPEAAFRPRANRYTTAATELATASRAIASAAGGGASGIAALVAEAEQRFAYAHPAQRFNDGADAVPYLSCGRTPGSCVDINTYLVASLRAAGYEAAYFYGYFFPAERGGVTDDGHCWVVTRHAGQVLEWDIAHHIKAGLGATRPGLNPRPGARVAVSHSMGHRYPGVDHGGLIKVLGEPMGLSPETGAHPLSLRARLAPIAMAEEPGEVVAAAR